MKIIDFELFNSDILKATFKVKVYNLTLKSFGISYIPGKGYKVDFPSAVELPESLKEKIRKEAFSLFLKKKKEKGKRNSLISQNTN